MNKYTWFTSKEKNGGGWYKCTAQVILSTNTLEFKDYPFYKPNRKGGHRRNAIYNAFNRIIFRSKNARQIDPTQKQEWRKTFEIQVFGELKRISQINFLDILKKGKHFKQANSGNTNESRSDEKSDLFFLFSLFLFSLIFFHLLISH